MLKVSKDTSLQVQEKPKETVTLLSVFAFLGFIFLLLGSFLFYLRFSGYSPLADYYAKMKAGEKVNIESMLATKIGKPVTGKKVEIQVSESELNSSLDLTTQITAIKKPVLKITANGIVLSGRTAAAFWGVSVSATIKPEVKNSMIKYEVTKIEAAGVQAPPKIADPLKSSLNLLLYNALPVEKNITVTEIRTMSGYLLIDGVAK
ncbi:MAG: hypothetical protein NTW50_05520 [Candidatus Berkelbacteria bacterium]|nr:hypothetical protein [Candidatus Berkelbacteria bacterium]